MNKLAKYTGLAYNYQTYNCWHHVRAVRRDAGIDTPEFDCRTPELIEASRKQTKGMVKIENPEPYCAVLMYTKREKWHAGVYLDGLISHCDRNARQVRIDTLKSINKIAERVEFWR